MKVKVVESIEELKKSFGLQNDGDLLETDLDVVENDCELFGRKRRDAEVLCTLAANSRGNCLDLGTSHGRSAFKLGTNLKENGRVFTVNILPEHYDRSSGQLITHLLAKEEIGSFYRAHQLQNIEQIYANTATWTVPPEINDLAIVFVDAAHDTEMVYADTKRIYDRVRDGGFILWHDFSPFFRAKHGWIDAVMRGVEKFLNEYQIDAEIVHLRNSWIGILQKTRQAKFAVVSSAPATRLRASANAGDAPLLPDRMKSVRYFWAYPAYSQERIEEEDGYIARIRQLGYQIEGVPLFCPGGWWPFPKLNEAWRNRSSALMAGYEMLADRVTSGDVLVAAGGAMLHPEFVRQLPSFNVFVCCDDPENSEILSKPVAPAFDFSFPMNVACLDLYRSWGCKEVAWLYHALRPELMDANLTEEKILRGERDLDLVMFCERIYGLSDRAQRLESLAREFPQVMLRGKGWPGGYLSQSEMRAAYARAKIGWNLHNSIGPVNSRVITLPAFGVMQICDNRQHLGQLFKLDEEVVGFDSIEECVEKTRYYLAHDKERRQIAARGWKRATSEFTEARQWERLVATIAPVHAAKFNFSAQKTDKASLQLCSNPARNHGSSTTGCNGHPHPSEKGALFQNVPSRRPRVLLLADRPGWAYDTVAKALVQWLSDEFEFRIEYVAQEPDLKAWPFDLIYVFFWGETYHQRFVNEPRRIIKEVSSHRWALEDQYGRLTPKQMAARHLADAGAVTSTSRRLQQLLSPFRTVLPVANGFDPELYADRQERHGPLKIGWAGNAADSCKGLKDVLQPAAGTDFELRLAGGKLGPAEMRDFYNSIDVLCVASTAEGTPLPLLEAMACGCFPVATDVGIVPEVIRHRDNGLVVTRTAASFRAAFQWCATNVGHVRKAGALNPSRIGGSRSWQQTAGLWRQAFWQVLGAAGWPRNGHGKGQTTVSSPQSAVKTEPTERIAQPTPMAELKQNYYDHLKQMNPNGTAEATYQASLFYYRAEVLPLLPADKNARCVDLGCGFGHLLRFLLEQGYQRVGGVEIDEHLFQACQSYVGPRTAFLAHQDAAAFLQPAQGEFDFVTVFDVIEHFNLEEGLALLRLIHQALRPGGRVLLRTPNMANIFGAYSRYVDLTHQSGFTEQSLAQLLRQAGFAKTRLHLPVWESAHPLADKLKESADFHRRWFDLQDRATPQCFEKNIVMWADK